MTETISHGQYGIRTRMKPEDRTSQYVAENVQRLLQRDSNKEDEHMKFYYNGQLIRTSKNHVYTHACIDIETNDLKGCSASREGAEKVKNDRLRELSNHLENEQKRLKALQEGKSGYHGRDGRKAYYYKFGSCGFREDTIEEAERYIDWYLKEIEKTNKAWQIVELEAREK